MEETLYRVIERKPLFTLKDDFFTSEIIAIQDGMRQIEVNLPSEDRPEVKEDTTSHVSRGEDA